VSASREAELAVIEFWTSPNEAEHRSEWASEDEVWEEHLWDQYDPEWESYRAELEWEVIQSEEDACWASR